MSKLQGAFLKTILIDEKFSYIKDLSIKWFDGDDQQIFMICAYLYSIKKSPSYQQVKSLIELAKDIKEYKREDLLARMDFIKSEVMLMPTDDPVAILRKQWEHDRITKDIEGLGKLEHTNKVAILKKLAEDLREDVGEFNTSILQDEINKFADDLEKGEANDTTGSIDLTNHWDRNSELCHQMICWKKIFGHNFIQPKFHMIGARPGDYKTSMLIDLTIMLYRMGRRGLYFSFEDTKDDLRIKFLSQMYGRDKKELSTVRKDEDFARMIRKPADEKIIIHDQVLDYDKLMSTVEFYTARYRIDFICLDYVQLFTGKLPIKERMDVVAQDIMEVTRQFKVPFFCLSQVSKDDTKNDSADSRLHKRHVKDSKKLAETPRFMGFLYGDNHTPTRNFNRDKVTMGACADLVIDFDGPTGRILEVRDASND
jgi:hypothetical protein